VMSLYNQRKWTLIKIVIGCILMTHVRWGAQHLDKAADETGMIVGRPL
jgi:hypothetical protein